MVDAFKFVKDNGLTSYTNYPYTARDGTCDNEKVEERVASITGY